MADNNGYDFNSPVMPKTFDNNSSYVQRIDNDRRFSNRFYGSMFLRLMFLIVLCIFLIRIFWRLRGHDSGLSFTAFLDWLSNLNGLEITINLNSFAIGGDWGIFDFLRNFFNIFANLFGVIVWLFANIINIVIYLGSFLVFIFG